MSTRRVRECAGAVPSVRGPAKPSTTCHTTAPHVDLDQTSTWTRPRLFRHRSPSFISLVSRCPCSQSQRSIAGTCKRIPEIVEKKRMQRRGAKKTHEFEAPQCPFAMLRGRKILAKIMTSRRCCAAAAASSSHGPLPSRRRSRPRRLDLEWLLALTMTSLTS